MKKTVFALSLALALLVASRPADAKIFEVWGSGIAGAVLGNGNAASDRDFFNWASGGGAGVEIGARFLFLGAFIDYVRFFGGDAGANLFTFNLGSDTEVGLSGGLKLVLRLAGSFYYGTLDSTTVGGETSAAVNTRGIGARGGVGLRYVFARIFSLGFTPEIAYHYFFGGSDSNLADTSTNSHGWNLRLMGYFRVGLGF